LKNSLCNYSYFGLKKLFESKILTFQDEKKVLRVDFYTISSFSISPEWVEKFCIIQTAFKLPFH